MSGVGGVLTGSSSYGRPVLFMYRVLSVEKENWEFVGYELRF